MDIKGEDFYRFAKELRVGESFNFKKRVMSVERPCEISHIQRPLFEGYGGTTRVWVYRKR